MTGLRKNVKLIANRSRQPTVRSSAGTGSTPNSSTAGIRLLYAVASVAVPSPVCGSPMEEVDHDAVVLLGVVEDGRVARAAMTCFSAPAMPR